VRRRGRSAQRARATKKLRKLIFTTDSTEHGGAEDHLRVLAAEFHKRGNQVRVLLPEAAGTRRLVAQMREQGVATAPLPLMAMNPDAVLQTWKAVVFNVFRLVFCFRRQRPDLIHFVVSWPTRDNWCGMIAALVLGIPYVVDFQLVPPVVRCPPSERGLLKHLGAILNYVYSRADSLICVSQGNQRRLAELFGIAAARIQIIYNGIDTNAFEQADRQQLCRLRKELALTPERIVLTTVARLNIQKGHRYLIDAAKQLAAANPRVVFLLVGDGELRVELERAVKESGLSDKFIFAGYRRDVAELLALTDIFVLPTLFEGLPHSVLEAMAAGCCVVASRVDGVAEVVEDGETGILVEAANVEQLVAALNPLVHDEDARNEMGRKGMMRVKEKFGLSRMVEGVDSLYTAAWFARSSQHLS